jgi:putative glutamine amidotransferase
LTLLRLVVDAQKPVFTICRGTQALNVALGGSLIGDIATQQPQALKHDWFPGFRRDKLVHQVQIDPSSRISAIIGAQSILTNSLHHQAIDRPAPGLRVTARATDGIIEAVEEPTLPFVVGVQWHPECLPEVASMRALFAAFVASC